MKIIPGQIPIITGDGCPARISAIADAIYAIGGKWKLPIVLALAGGNQRFNDLHRLVQGISPKVLSSELKELELNGLIERKVSMAGTQMMVDYELTEYCVTLHKVLDALSEWGMMHKEKIKQGFREKRQEAATNN